MEPDGTPPVADVTAAANDALRLPKTRKLERVRFEVVVALFTGNVMVGRVRANRLSSPENCAWMVCVPTANVVDKLAVPELTGGEASRLLPSEIVTFPELSTPGTVGWTVAANVTVWPYIVGLIFETKLMCEPPALGMITG